MSKLHRPGRNTPTEMSFLKTGRGAKFGSAQFCFEPTTCSRIGQQTVAFQGTAPATSNPPGVTVYASIFLHYVEAWCLNRRSDALENRRKLMEAWASYCEPRTAGTWFGLGTGNARIERLVVCWAARIGRPSDKPASTTRFLRHSLDASRGCCDGYSAFSRVTSASTDTELVGLVDPPLHLSPCRNYGIQQRKHNS